MGSWVPGRRARRVTTRTRNLGSRPRGTMSRSSPRLSRTLWRARACCRARRARSATGLARSRAHVSRVPRMMCACVCIVEQFWMAQNVVLWRVMAAFSASLRPGRRAAGGMRGRSVGAEPMWGGVVCGVDARGMAEARCRPLSGSRRSNHSNCTRRASLQARLDASTLPRRTTRVTSLAAETGTMVL